MACYSPIKAYRDSSGTLFFHSKVGTNVIKLPCGQCVGCRLERSRVWAARCVHESQMHDSNCFITLTYKDNPVSLDYRDFQLFMKRLRSKTGKRVRFFMCGEYGENNSRPHYHAILFGYDFSDKVRFGRNFFRSPFLESLWPHGFSSVGEMTFESAAYVARYCLKKVTGDLAESHYRIVDKETGEVSYKVPEFCHMSLKPGIGAEWLKKYTTDVYPSGKMVVRGSESNSARYYDKLYKRLEPEAYEGMKALRRLEGVTGNALEQTDYRLRVKKAVTEARLRLLKRNKFE